MKYVLILFLIGSCQGPIEADHYQRSGNSFDEDSVNELEEDKDRLGSNQNRKNKDSEKLSSRKVIFNDDDQKFEDNDDKIQRVKTKKKKKLTQKIDEEEKEIFKEDEEVIEEEVMEKEEVVVPYVVGNEVEKFVEIQCGSQTAKADFDVYLSGSTDFNFGSWNNFGSDPTSDPVDKYNDNAYKPDMGLVKESDCGDREVITSTFVKKLHNWHSQHFNGLVLTGGNVEIENIAGVVVEFKANSVGSTIPDANMIKDALGNTYQSRTGQNFNAADLDESQHDYLLTFEHAASGKVLKARYHFQLENEEIDKWIRFVIPADKLEWFYEENYVAQPLSYNTAVNQGLSFARAVFVAETSSLSTLRNMINVGDDGTFNNLNVTPVFKEQNITLHRVSFINRP